MRPHRHPHRRTQRLRHKTSEAGNITVFFCMLAAILIGAVSYSLYVGQMTADRIVEQNAADSSAVSMAGHAAQGLNMIAANNLTTGAAVQVATSVANLAVYIATIRTIFTQLKDLKDLPSSPGQKIMDKMKVISSPFVRVASGVTEHNRKLYDFWMYAAPIRGLEVARANVPGAVAVPIQRSLIRVAMHRPFQYQGMKLTSPKKTVCQTFRAIDQKDSTKLVALFDWLAGPFMSMSEGVHGVFSGIKSVIGTIESLLTSLPAMDVTLPQISKSGEECAFAVKMGFKFGIKLPRIPGFPRMIPPGGIGVEIDEPVTFLGDQAEYFGTIHGQDVLGHFGFLYPHPDESRKEQGSDDPYDFFKGSVEIASVLVNPLRSSDQLNPTRCPDGFKRDGKCDAVGLVGLGTGTPQVQQAGSEALDREGNMVSGGLRKTMGEGGSMRSTVSRFKYRIGQARAEFLPNDKDPQGARENASRENTALTTFWPAWRAKGVRPTLLGDVMKRLGTGSGDALWSGM